MKFMLAGNILGHPAFAQCITDAAASVPNLCVLICGDLINVFPEPGEDMQGSIFFELYGELLVNELTRLNTTHFRDVARSPLIEPLRSVFESEGPIAIYARERAMQRYTQLFGALRAASTSSIFFVPGNMDYPDVARALVSTSPRLHLLDGEIAQVGHLQIGGVGGILHENQPFNGVTSISPYELTRDEFRAQLQQVYGADVLVTHISPSESPDLAAFVRDSPVQTVISRAPFMLGKQGSCRGDSSVGTLHGKTVVHVRPFEFPENTSLILDFDPNSVGPPTFSTFTWPSHSLPSVDNLRELQQNA